MEWQAGVERARPKSGRRSRPTSGRRARLERTHPTRSRRRAAQSQGPSRRAETAGKPGTTRASAMRASRADDAAPGCPERDEQPVANSEELVGRQSTDSALPSDSSQFLGRIGRWWRRLSAPTPKHAACSPAPPAGAAATSQQPRPPGLEPAALCSSDEAPALPPDVGRTGARGCPRSFVQTWEAIEEKA